MADPQTWEDGLDQALAHVRVVMIGRHRKYGPGNIRAFEELGILVRASDKFERLKHAILQGGAGSEDFADDTVDDAWTDFAGYGLIALMWRWGLWELRLAPTEDQETCQGCDDPCENPKGHDGLHGTSHSAWGLKPDCTRDSIIVADDPCKQLAGHTGDHVGRHSVWANVADLS